MGKLRIDKKTTKINDMCNIIYLARNKESGKEYVGLTTTALEERKKAHEYYALKGNKCPFACAIRKYGVDGFKWTILCRCYFKYNLKPREMYWIKKLKTKVPNGYNLTDGGDGGDTFSYRPIRSKNITKKKMSKEMKKRWKDFEYRRKMKKAFKNMKPRSIESVEKYRKTNLGEKNPTYRADLFKKRKKARILYKQGKMSSRLIANILNIPRYFVYTPRLDYFLGV